MTVELMCAAITAFLPNGDLDLPGTEQLLRAFKASGTDSVIAPGTTGEFTSLTDDERTAVIEKALAVFGPEHTYAHVGAATSRQAARLATRASALGARKLAAITPFFVTAGPTSVVDYYRAVTQSVPQAEVYAYIFPARATTTVTPETLAAIATVPGMAGAKISGLPFADVVAYIAAVPPTFRVFAGNDADIVRVAEAGGAGVVSGVSCVFPTPFVAATAAINAGHDARKYQDAIDAAVAAVGHGDLGLLKAGVSYRGLPAGRPRVSVEPPTPLQLRRLEEAVRAAQRDDDLVA